MLMSVFATIVAGMFAFAAAYIATRFLSRFEGGLQILDRPNARSLHSVPTPRTGGLGIWLGLIAGVAVAFATGLMREGAAWIGAAAIAVGVISVIDDRFDVSAAVRLAVHITAGVLLVYGGLSVTAIQVPGLQWELTPAVALVVTVLFSVWMTNLYNFMDGMDGLAGGMAVAGFGTLGGLGWVAGDEAYALLNGVIAAAAGGFLVVNFPPARIFMGDAGSSTLGLLAAAMALWADRQGLFPLWVSVMVFSPFIVDASVTLIRRSLRGDRIWEAHRSHYYQRLVQAGWTHRRAALWEYALMGLCTAAAFVSMRVSAKGQWVVIGVVALLYVGAIIGVRGAERRFHARTCSGVPSANR